jgi:tRNA U38,U39,U40 pseudouridine synthase TruA
MQLIGLMVPIVKGMCDEDVIEKAYNPARKYSTPLAPGLGLILAKV